MVSLPPSFALRYLCLTLQLPPPLLSLFFMLYNRYLCFSWFAPSYGFVPYCLLRITKPPSHFPGRSIWSLLLRCHNQLPPTFSYCLHRTHGLSLLKLHILFIELFIIYTGPLPPYLIPFLANPVTTFFTSFLTAVTTCIATVNAEFDAEMEQELNKSWDPLPPSPTTTQPPSLLSTALATAPNLFSNWRSLYSSPSPDATSTSMTKVIPETPLPACLRTPLG